MNREDHAFAALYAAHFEFVWRTIRAMGVGPSAVEDLVQEVFMVVRRKQATHDPNRSERAWLFGIARNEVLQFRRSSARYQRRIHRLEPPIPPLRPDQQLQDKQAAALLEAFLDQLDEGLRLSFLLADLEGMSGREAAAGLAIPIQTHYSRVRVARRRLAKFASQLQPPEDRNGTVG